MSSIAVAAFTSFYLSPDLLQSPELQL